MTALLDLCSRLPRQLWDEADAAAHDQRHWPQLVAALPKGALVVFDLGYTNFEMFLQLTLAQVTVVTRAKSNLAYQVARVLRRTAQVHELIVWIGSGEARQQLRLIEVLWHGKWYRYLTNELGPATLPPEDAVALYWQRWRIETSQPQCRRTDHRSGLDAALVALPCLSMLPRRRSYRLLDVRCARRLTDPDPTDVVPVRPLVALA